MDDRTTTTVNNEQEQEHEKVQIGEKRDGAKSKMSVQIRKLERLEATGGRLDHGDS